MTMERKPSPQIETMMDDAKLGLSAQLTRYRQRMMIQELDPKEMSAFVRCVDALEKLARLEGAGVFKYDLGGLTDEQVARLEGEAARFLNNGTDVKGR